MSYCKTFPYILESGKPTEKKIKTLAEYRSLKGKQWKSKVTKPKSDKDTSVVINIGTLEWNEKEAKLKPKRGKRLVLRVSILDKYHTILQKAQEKWRAYHSECYDEREQYILTYESGEQALFLPGTSEVFNLKTYQEEVGKDFKRIVLYLCKTADIDFCDHIKEKKYFTDVDENISNDEMVPERKLDDKKQDATDHEIAVDLQIAFDLENDNNGHKKVISEKIINCTYQSQVELVKALHDKINSEEQFYIVIRRGSSLQRKLSLWQRECKKSTPLNRLMVHFAGENGIDTGALAQEFLSDVMADMSRNIFQNGAPIDSMLNVHNGNFFTCGEIVSVSIAQRGPPPCLFADCVFDMMVNPDIDLKNLKVEEHLTKFEKLLLDSVLTDTEKYTELIIDHGYTGVINQQNAAEIVGTLMVSFVSRRIVFLKEFSKGLELFGLYSIVRNNKELCRSLFVKDSYSPVNANYVLSLLTPKYSAASSTRKSIEEKVIDHFQDLLISFEDENNDGYLEALAWDESSTEGNLDDKVVMDSITPDLSPAGVLGWLTGQKHKPLNGEIFSIHVNFDHDCHVRFPSHTICFPLVGACGREVTFPVTHMKTLEDFKRVFLIAFCKGQAFSLR